jgi:PAS domain S-box-containing protein
MSHDEFQELAAAFNQMAATLQAEITQHRQAQTTLEELTRLQRTLLQSVNYAIISTTIDGTILTFNAAAEALLGYRSVEVVGQTTPEIFHDAAEVAQRSQTLSQELGVAIAPGFEVFVAKARRGEVEEQEWTYIRKDGSHVPVLLSVTALRDYAGTLTGFVGIASDLTERKQKQVALWQLATIVESSNDAIISTTPDGKILTWNRGAEQLYGYTASEIEGQLITLLKPDVLPADARSTLSQDHQEVKQRRKDGRLIDVFLTVSLIKDEQERGLGMSLISRDISDRREVERLKDEFTSVVSHELRTPLTAIRTALGAMASGKLGELLPRGQHMLQIAIDNTDRLVRLISDILDLERIAAGKITLYKENCPVAELIDQAVAVMQPLADQAGLTVVVTTVPLQVCVDRDRMQQTLTNLLSNAIKFSDPGGKIWLTAELQGQAAQGSQGKVLITVKDQGRGIPADKLDSIFERFQQVDASDSRQKGGTGLGLAISRSIVQQHGGKLWADSTLGKGSSFFMTLPIS